MHTKSLTRRDFLSLLDLLEGALGFNPGLLCALASLGEFGLLIGNIALQGLKSLDRALELLLRLANLGLVLLVRGTFLGRFVLDLGQRLLEGRHLGRGP